MPVPVQVPAHLILYFLHPQAPRNVLECRRRGHVRTTSVARSPILMSAVGRLLHLCNRKCCFFTKSCASEQRTIGLTSQAHFDAAL
jgi:hypothetical protein